MQLVNVCTYLRLPSHFLLQLIIRNSRGHLYTDLEVTCPTLQDLRGNLYLFIFRLGNHSRKIWRATIRGSHTDARSTQTYVRPLGARLDLWRALLSSVAFAACRLRLEIWMGWCVRYLSQKLDWECEGVDRYHPRC
jgi:hypothetical protein